MAKNQFEIPKFEKGYTPKKYGKYGFGSNDHLAAASNIAQSRLQSQMSVPHQEDIDADLYAGLNKKIGDRPSLASGFLSGLESGSRGKANQKRRDVLDKYENFMGYLQEVNADAMQRIDEQKKQEALKAKYLPEVLTYIRSTTKLDPQSQLATVQSMFKRYAQETGTNIEVLGIDSTDPNVVTLGMSGSPDAGTTRLDLRDFFADNQQVQQELAMLGPEYQAMLQEKRQQLEIENRQADRNADLRQQAIYSANDRNDMNFNKMTFAQDPYRQFEVQTGKQQGKEAATQLTKLETANDEFYDVSDRVQDLKNLLANSDVITGQTLGAKAQRIFGGWTGSKAYSDTELYDAIAGGLFGYVKGQEKYGNLNQNEFSFLTGRIPTSEKTKAGALSLLNQFERRLNRSIERNNQKIARIPNYGYPTEQIMRQGPVQEEIVDVPIQAPVANIVQEEVLPPQGVANAPVAPQSYQVKVQRPDGVIVLMDPETAEEAKKHGGKIIK